MPQPELSVIIPCLNEEESLRMLEGEIFESLRGLGIPFEVLFIDDGSTDRTAEILRALAGRRPQARVLSHSKTRGMGAALQTGFQEASGRLVATLDADLSFHPRLLARLLSRIREGGLDCVIGSPFLGALPAPGAAPWRRRWLSQLANRAYQALLGGFTAATPIFRVYKSELSRRMKLSSSGFTVNAEALFWMRREGAKVAEVPAELEPRRAGRSKLKVLPVVLSHLRLMAEILFWKIREGRQRKATESNE